MGTFDTDDIDDELLGSIFDDWDNVLSGGFGDILDASSSFDALPQSSAESIHASQTVPSVEGSLSELGARSLSVRPASPRSAMLQTPGAVTQPAFDASLSELGAKSASGSKGLPTLPRGSAPAVQDMSLSQLDPEWFQEEADGESTRFGDMTEHVARMALMADPSPTGGTDATRFDQSAPEGQRADGQAPVDDELAGRTVLQGHSERHLDDAFRDFADRSEDEDRPTTPQSQVGKPRGGTDEEFQRFIDGPSVQEPHDVGQDVAQDSVTRFDDSAMLLAGGSLLREQNERSAMLRENGVTLLDDFAASPDDSVTRFDDSIRDIQGLEDASAIRSGVLGLSRSGQGIANSSVLGDSSFADSAATRFGDSASIAAADHRESGALVSVPSHEASADAAESAATAFADATAPDREESSRANSDERATTPEASLSSETSTTLESAALSKALPTTADEALSAALPTTSDEAVSDALPTTSDEGVSDNDRATAPADAVDDAQAANVLAESASAEELAASGADGALPNEPVMESAEPLASNAPVSEESGAPATSEPAASRSPRTDVPDLSLGAGIMRQPNRTPLPSATPAPSLESQRVESGIAEAVEDDVLEVSAPASGTELAGAPRFDSSIPDESAISEELDSPAGEVESQPTPAPVEPVGVVITLDHSVGPAEVERRVQDAVMRSGQCTLALGPRSVVIDRVSGVRGQWRAVEAAQDRAFAAGSVRSLIRRITSPRRGRDSVLDDLERRLARS